MGCKHASMSSSLRFSRSTPACFFLLFLISPVHVCSAFSLLSTNPKTRRGNQSLLQEKKGKTRGKQKMIDVIMASSLWCHKVMSLFPLYFYVCGRTIITIAIQFSFLKHSKKVVFFSFFFSLQIMMSPNDRVDGEGHLVIWNQEKPKSQNKLGPLKTMKLWLQSASGRKSGHLSWLAWCFCAIRGFIKRDIFMLHLFVFFLCCTCVLHWL